jgi:phosphopantetheinyl transferase
VVTRQPGDIDNAIIWLGYRLSLHSLSQCQPWLTPDEWQFVRQATDKRARQFANGRSLIRRLLQQQLAIAPPQIQITLPDGTAPQLLVRGQRWHLSISHAGQAVSVAISQAHAPGIDIEQTKPRQFAQLSQHYAALAQASDCSTFYRLWTAAEAYSKASAQSIWQVLAQPLPATAQYHHLELTDYTLCLCYLSPPVSIITFTDG